MEESDKPTPTRNRRSTDDPFDPSATTQLDQSLDFIKGATDRHAEAPEDGSTGDDPSMDRSSIKNKTGKDLNPEKTTTVFNTLVRVLGMTGWGLVILSSVNLVNPFPQWELSWHMGIFMTLAFTARVLGFRVVDEVRIALDTAIYVAGVFILGVVPGAWLVLLVLTVDTSASILRGAHHTPQLEIHKAAVIDRLIRRGGIPALIVLCLGALFRPPALDTQQVGDLLYLTPLFTVAFLVIYYLFVIVSQRTAQTNTTTTVLFMRLVRAELTQVPIALTLVLGYYYGEMTLFLLLGFTALMFSGIFQRNALARQQIAKRLDELSTLNEVGKIISASLELRPLLQHLATATLKHVGGASRFTVGLIHGDDYTVTHEIYDATGRQYRTLKVDRNTGLAGWVLRHKKPLLLGDVQRQYSMYAKSTDKAVDQFQSWLCVPIMLYEEVIGVISIQSDQLQAYTEDHLRVLTTITDQAAVAIENARLYGANAQAREALSERVDELSTLNEVGKIISAILERDPLAEKIATATLRLVGESSRFMICFGPENSNVLAGGLFDHTGKCYQEISVNRGQSLSGWAMNNRKPLLLADVQTEYQTYLPNYAYNDSRFHSWLCVPLIYNNEVRGAMSLQSERVNAYTKNHLRVLTNIADQAAVAFENTRLYELATVDGLTGLYVRRHFDQRIHAEWERANRAGTELSLLLLDLDSFKAINDTHGHQVGDLILQSASNCVRQHLRTSDLPCRYGGDEFAIILPETDLDGARHVSERIRAEIESQSVSLGDTEASLTCSIGVSCFPSTRITSLQQLIQIADDSLYLAKERGRNLVVTQLDIAKESA